MLFDKRPKEPERPRLQGEDFDIFPDLGEPKPKQPVKEEPADEPEPEPTELQKKVAAISEKTWKRLQIAGGIVLGLGSSACIVLMNGGGEFGTFGILIAAVLALIVPGFLEKQFARKMPTLRVALILSLAISMAVYMFYGFVIDPSIFQKGAASASSLTASPSSAS